MRRARRAVGAGTLSVAVLLALASIAWACVTTDGPYVTDPQPHKAPAGSEVSLSGGQWAPDQEVSVGWSSDGREVSRQLATAATDSSGSFQAKFKVPEAGSGIHYLVVTQGQVSRATAFEVTAPAQGPSSSPNPQQSGGTDTSAGGSSPGQSRPASQASGSSESDVTRSTQGSPVAGGFPGEQPAPQPVGAPASAGATAQTRALDSGPLANRTGSAPPAAGSKASPGTVVEAQQGAVAAPAVPTGSAFSDGWPAFQSGSSFRDTVRLQAPAGQGSSSATAVALLGLTLGLMAVSAGFGFAEASSRRQAVARR